LKPALVRENQNSVQVEERENTLAANKQAICQWMKRQEAADVVACLQEETE
jgi:quinolinate synthase